MNGTPDSTAAEAFANAQRMANEAKAKLADRLAAIAVERRETVARLRAEAKEIRVLIGRPRKTNGTTKPRAPRKPKAPKAAAETAGA